MGAFAVCHWFYYLGSQNTTQARYGGTVGTDWGETRILTEEQWGNGGSVIKGANIQASGRRLDTTYNGFALGNAGTTYGNSGDYTMSWYQPPYAASYGAGHLRRYNGNAQNPDMVRPYCISARSLTSVSKMGVTAGDRNTAGILTVSGATTLAAGVIAYGVASLAF